jgi:hypothetical protein
MENVPVFDTDVLYRHLHQQHVDRHGNVRSNAYKYNRIPQSEPSVDLAKLTTPEESLARRKPDWGLGTLTAADVRAIDDLDVRHDPLAGDPAAGIPPNPAHAVIETLPDSTEGLHYCDELASRTTVLIPPK